MSNSDNDSPLGGIFACIGFFVGGIYGAYITDHGFGGLAGMFIGLFLGKIVEHIVFRAILIALSVLAFVARHALFDAIFTAT